tara:strand:+ start:2284 stop:2472 length:189 start_codon:yes stop_codon:yes gene_type:complete
MDTLEKEIQEAKEGFEKKELTKEEFEYIIKEIKEVRTAEELAGDEIAIRRIVNICDVALSII